MLINNSTNTKSLIGESLLELIAKGTATNLPSKVLVEVRCNSIDPANRVTEVGSGQGKFSTPAMQSVNPYTYDNDYRYDFKISDGINLQIDTSVTANTLQESGKLVLTYGVDIGGGVTLNDWCQTECAMVSIERIDLLSDTNVTLARQQPTLDFPYSGGLMFNFDIIIDADEISSIATIDDEWLVDLSKLLDGTDSVQSKLKATAVEYYDDADNLLNSSGSTQVDLDLIEFNHQSLTYRGTTDSTSPSGTPKYFKIKTDQDRTIYQNDFNWSPPWQTGDTIIFTYSV